MLGCLFLCLPLTSMLSFPHFHPSELWLPSEEPPVEVLDIGLQYCGNSCCSVAKSCPTLCDPMDCSTPGSSVLHHRPEFAQTHVYWVSDAYVTVSSSVTPFSSCLQSFPASGSFPASRLFASGSQSIGASASASVLPMSIQGWFPLGWLVWSPCCPRDSQ